MAEREMPIGTPYYFEGDISEIDPDAFGFFNVEVTAPTDMNRPLLQTRVNNRTLAPLGTWNDFIFSEEMKSYQKYGYSFVVKGGYLFDKAFIFRDYVLDLYKIKKAHHKSDAMYLISKLLMNSLYGRFGMSINLPNHNIINNEQLAELANNDKFVISEIIDLHNGKSLISMLNKVVNTELEDTDLDISIPIAASVTAYARVHMAQFLADPSLDIYYTDTDSIFVDASTPLPNHMVGNELGQMKIEKTFSEAIFIAPKVYGGIFEGSLNELTKVKGFKNEMTDEMTKEDDKIFNVKYLDLKKLLIKDSKLELNQEKWTRSIGNGHIIVEKTNYNLVATESKRRFILDDNNLFVNTKPYVINKDKKII